MTEVGRLAVAQICTRLYAAGLYYSPMACDMTLTEFSNLVVRAWIPVAAAPSRDAMSTTTIQAPHCTLICARPRKRESMKVGDEVQSKVMIRENSVLVIIVMMPSSAPNTLSWPIPAPDT